MRNWNCYHCNVLYCKSFIDKISFPRCPVGPTNLVHLAIFHAVESSYIPGNYSMLFISLISTGKDITYSCYVAKCINLNSFIVKRHKHPLKSTAMNIFSVIFNPRLWWILRASSASNANFIPGFFTYFYRSVSFNQISQYCFVLLLKKMALNRFETRGLCFLIVFLRRLLINPLFVTALRFKPIRNLALLLTYLLQNGG